MNKQMADAVVVTETIDGVNDALVVPVALGTDAVTFWLRSAASLAGLTLVPEVQFETGGPWVTKSYHASNATNLFTLVAVTPALTGVPVYAMTIHCAGAVAVRMRASAITGGSCVLAAKPTSWP